MATNFPTGLDALTNPNPTDPTTLPSHSAQHTNANDAIEAMQTKIGINASVDVTSLDYLLKNASSSNPGHTHTLASGASDVTSSAAELNQLDGVTVGGTSSGDIATIDDIQTLTNKTIDADDNTISNLAHGAEVDNPSSGVHGVVGSVVGTSDTQNISGKTITDTLSFTDATPVNMVEQSAEPGTPTTGDIYLDDGTNTASGDPGFRRYTGAVWEDISGGGGSPSPLTTKGDIFTYDTGGARLPVSGNNGYVLSENSATATGLQWVAASGGSSPLTTKGDLFGYDTGDARIPVGTNGQVLVADSSDAQGVVWQNTSAVSITSNELPSGTINGSNVTFTLAGTPLTGSLNLYQNGIRLKSTDDYSITGNTITFVTAPVTNDILLADYRTSTTNFVIDKTLFVYNETPSGSVNGSNTVFTTAFNFTTSTTQVYLDGQRQVLGGSNDYTETDVDEITFNTAPVLGTIIRIDYIKA